MRAAGGWDTIWHRLQRERLGYGGPANARVVAARVGRVVALRSSTPPRQRVLWRSEGCAPPCRVRPRAEESVGFTLQGHVRVKPDANHGQAQRRGERHLRRDAVVFKAQGPPHNPGEAEPITAASQQLCACLRFLSPPCADVTIGTLGTPVHVDAECIRLAVSRARPCEA